MDCQGEGNYLMCGNDPEPATECPEGQNPICFQDFINAQTQDQTSDSGGIGGGLTSTVQSNYCAADQVLDGRTCVTGLCKTPNTAPDTNRICQSVNPSTLATYDSQESASNKVRLTALPSNYNMAAVLQQGSADQQRFISDFIQYLAKATGLPADAFEISDISEGSVIVDFKIKPTTLPGGQAILPGLVSDQFDVLKTMLSIRQDLGGFFKDIDSTYGATISTGTESGAALSGAEALMAAFTGDDLKDVPPKTVENPILYSFSTVGLANRDKSGEYLPSARSSATQDENWDSPASMNLDVALFISPIPKEVTVDNFCPTMSLDGDPVTNMWASNAATGYGGTLVKANPKEEDKATSQFRWWRLPAEKRMRIEGCQAMDWLEELQRLAGKDPNNITVTSASNAQAVCGIPDDVWTGTPCQSMDQLSSVYRDQFKRFCNTELFPAVVFNYAVSTPINYKWIMKTKRDPGLLYKAEWGLDTMTAYYMTWDYLAEETEKAFKAKAPPGGDWIQQSDNLTCGAYSKTPPCAEPQLFSGKLLYKGRHSGDNQEVIGNAGVGLHQIPATSPALTPSVQLVLDIDATVDMVSRVSPDMWPSDTKLLRKVLECNTKDKFDYDSCFLLSVTTPIFPYDIDVTDAVSALSIAKDRSLALQPGMSYLLDIDVSIQPIYVKTFWSGTPWAASGTIATWIVNVGGVSASSAALAFNERGQAQVRVRVNFDSGARRLIQKPIKTIFDLIADVGTWAGLWAMAAGVALALLNVLKPFGKLGPLDPDIVPELVQKRIEDEQEEHCKKEAKRIKKELEKQYPGRKISLKKVRTLIVDAPCTLGVHERVDVDELLVDKVKPGDASGSDQVLEMAKDTDEEDAPNTSGKGLLEKLGLRKPKGAAPAGAAAEPRQGLLAKLCPCLRRKRAAATPTTPLAAESVAPESAAAAEGAQDADAFVVDGGDPPGPR